MKGLLLINLGTPKAPTAAEVGRYLRQFLMDPLVLDIPAPLRWFLVNAIIVPFRSPKSAEAYSTVWTEEGSPLMIHSQALQKKVQEKMQGEWDVRLAMRYGEPGIESVLSEWKDSASLEQLYVLPLYPQYALSSTQSSLDEVKASLHRLQWQLPVSCLGDFPNYDPFVDALARGAQETIDRFQPDHVLMSFHGLPLRHVTKLAESGSRCGNQTDCCDSLREDNKHCYRAQSFATARALANKLNLDQSQYQVAFQSRLGRAEWIRPYTDHLLQELAASGKRRLAVICPSFVADCLETLEEIQIRGREDFIAAGGEELLLIPCLNSEDSWATAVSRMPADLSWQALEY